MALLSSPRRIVLVAVTAVVLDALLMIFLRNVFEEPFTVEPGAIAIIAAVLGVLTGVAFYGLTRLPAPQSAIGVGSLLAVLNLIAIGVGGFIIEKESYAVLSAVMSGTLMALSIVLIAWFLSIDTERDRSA